MDDFLGTSIQYSERQIKRLEREYAEKMERTVKELLDAGFMDSDYISSSETETSPNSDTEQSSGDSVKASKCQSVAGSVNKSSCSIVEDDTAYLTESGGSAFQRANRLLHSQRNFMARDPYQGHFHRSSFNLQSTPSGHRMATSRASHSMANLQYALPPAAPPPPSAMGPQPVQRSNSVPNLMNGVYPSPVYSRSFCQLPPMTTIMRHFLRL